MLPSARDSKAPALSTCGCLPQVCHESGNTIIGLATDEETSMPLQNHVTELERRHEALERELHDAVARPSADAVRVAELKRRKLQLKDEIYRLKRTTH
jgi:hypothetical protein